MSGIIFYNRLRTLKVSVSSVLLHLGLISRLALNSKMAHKNSILNYREKRLLLKEHIYVLVEVNRYITRDAKMVYNRCLIVYFCFK